MLETGSRAPELSFRNDEGALVGREELGQTVPVLFTFFKVSCPTCQLTLPYLERLHRQGAGQLRVVAVSQDAPDSTQDFWEYFKLTYPAVFDRAQDGYPSSNAFGITHVPSMFLVEPDGGISWTENGFKRDSLVSLACGAAWDVAKENS